MFRTITKKLPLLVIALVGSSALLASNNCDSCAPKETKCCDPCDTCCTSDCKEQGVILCEGIAAYNAPARTECTNPCADPCNDGWGVFINGSFIYWQPMEKGLEYAYTVPTDTTAAGSVHKMDYDFKPGFKVGLGFNFEHDSWDIYAQYLRLYTEHGNSVTDAADSALTSIWRVSNAIVLAGSTAHAKWHLDTDLVDLMLGRAFYCGKALIFKPHFGARAYWLHQKYNLEYPHTGDTVINHVHSSAKSWAVGPRAGLDSKWLLGSGFRIFGNVAASLAYQHFDTQFEQTDDATVTHAIKEIYRTLTPNMELALGLGWGTCFCVCNSSWYFDLEAGYEFHNFWGQNEMRALRDTLANQTDGAAGALMFHGLTVKATLGF